MGVTPSLCIHVLGLADSLKILILFLCDYTAFLANSWTSEETPPSTPLQLTEITFGKVNSGHGSIFQEKKKKTWVGISCRVIVYSGELINSFNAVLGYLY